jgi:hypothetical protein
MTALRSALCHSALSSAFNKIPSVEPHTVKRAVAMSVQQFSSYEKRQHKIPSRLITSKWLNIMQKCTVDDTDVHITFFYIFVRNFFVPPVTNLESYIWTVLTNACIYYVITNYKKICSTTFDLLRGQSQRLTSTYICFQTSLWTRRLV